MGTGIASEQAINRLRQMPQGAGFGLRRNSLTTGNYQGNFFIKEILSTDKVANLALF
jgi:hypothetical protein